jgi:hypothetical protein
MNEHQRIKGFDQAANRDSMRLKRRNREKHRQAGQGGIILNWTTTPDMTGLWNTIIFLIVVSAMFISAGLIAWRLNR